MQAGDMKTVTIPVDQAYGPYDDEMVAVVTRDRLPDDMEPEIGQQLQLKRDDGESLLLRVIDVSGEEVTLDGNHPLAGENLVFDITLVDIIEPKTEK